jgi:hypothetical protein
MDEQAGKLHVGHVNPLIKEKRAQTTNAGPSSEVETLHGYNSSLIFLAYTYLL